MNDGQIYVNLARLEKAGFIARDLSAPAGKVYGLTPSGQERVSEWLTEVSWPKPDLAEFHLKLVAAAQAGLADPIGIVDAQRRELLRRLRDVGRAAMAEPGGSPAGLLLEGMVLRLQADLRWLSCQKRLDRSGEAMNDNDSNTALVSARGLRKEYGSGEGLVRAVDEVDLEVAAASRWPSWARAAVGSRRSCTCSVGSTGRPPVSCGWRTGGSTGSPNGAWPGSGATTWASSSRPSISWTN